MTPPEIDRQRTGHDTASDAGSEEPLKLTLMLAVTGAATKERQTKHGDERNDRHR